MFAAIALALALGGMPEANPAPSPAALIGLDERVPGDQMYTWNWGDYLAWDKKYVWGNCATDKYYNGLPGFMRYQIDCEEGDPPFSWYCIVVVIEQNPLNSRYFNSWCDGGVIAYSGGTGDSLTVFGEEVTQQQYLWMMAQNLMGRLRRVVSDDWLASGISRGVTTSSTSWPD